MSDENEKKYLDLLRNSTGAISTGVGGALLGSSFGPIGALVGAVAGLLIGSNTLQELISEISAGVEIREWQEFFDSVPSNELSEFKISFAESIKSPSKSVSLIKWSSILDNLLPEERKSLKLRKEAFKAEKNLQRKKDELDDINRKIEEQRHALEELERKIEDFSPEVRDDILKVLQDYKDRGKNDGH
ncbi:MAG: hypothetical protein JNK81_05630 [Anaerolineales bacterium]|nr:hypothetical protein [Anaerolineales bacterium]